MTIKKVHTLLTGVTCLALIIGIMALLGTMLTYIDKPTDQYWSTLAGYSSIFIGLISAYYAGYTRSKIT